MERAADAYAELLADWQPVSAGIVDLVPGPLGKGELDGALRRRDPGTAAARRVPAARRARATPPAEPEADGDAWDAERRAPTSRPPRCGRVEAEVVEGAGAETVAGARRGAAEPAARGARAPHRAARRWAWPGCRWPRPSTGSPALERARGWWRRLYDSLAGIDPDRLTGLPVPLAGRRATDAIGPAAGPAAAARQADAAPTPRPRRPLARLGLKVAHPDAAHPLLEKLGALPATPRAVLTTPQVRAAVAASLDDEGETPGTARSAAWTPRSWPTPCSRLVRDAGLAPGDEPWLGALALPDEDGELGPGR